MPNHITNIIKIIAPEGRSAQEVIDYIRTEDRVFDFNTLIPMPQDAVDSIGTPGVSPLWYRWSVDNWGTKWNAYDISVSESSVRFDTAWSAPLPIFEALAERFPDYSFDIKYADENYGYNFGHTRFDPVGRLIYKLPKEGTPESYKWIFDNVLERPDYYDENGNYIGEDEE